MRILPNASVACLCWLSACWYWYKGWPGVLACVLFGTALTLRASAAIRRRKRLEK